MTFTVSLNAAKFALPGRAPFSSFAPPRARVSSGTKGPGGLRVRSSEEMDRQEARIPPGPSGKGFGSSGGGDKFKKRAGSEGKKRGGGTGPGLEQDVGKGKKTADKKHGLNKVVNIVDKKSSVNSSIDPAQAKLGKVDFVRVENWGSESDDSQKLEDLKIKSFSPSATSAVKTTRGPFYEKLVTRLQLLESKGDIAVVQVKPLPSFDRWAFGEDCYLQFLVDQRSVFEALRDGIGEIREGKCRVVTGTLEENVPLGGAASAIGLFDVNLGLDRCKSLSADITSIVSSSTRKGESDPKLLTADTQAAGYAQYLRKLGRAGVSDDEKAKESCLKLLAHYFAVYVSHLTTGMRIGAKALDNVASLRQTKALSFYRDYPAEVKDPLKLFIATINSAGKSIDSDDDHETVMQELAKAFQRTSLLLSVLAVEEPLVVAHG